MSGELIKIINENLIESSIKSATKFGSVKKKCTEFIKRLIKKTRRIFTKKSKGI